MFPYEIIPPIFNGNSFTVTANISNFTLQDFDTIQIENYINCASNCRGFSNWFLDSNNDKKKKKVFCKT